MNGIRVVMVVTEANPELLADLAKVPARLRAERIRTLATVGIAAMSGSACITRSLASGEPKENPRVDRQDDGKRGHAVDYAKSMRFLI